MVEKELPRRRRLLLLPEDGEAAGLVGMVRISTPPFTAETFVASSSSLLLLPDVLESSFAQAAAAAATAA